jgi:hypothetical protein
VKEWANFATNNSNPINRLGNLEEGQEGCKWNLERGIDTKIEGSAGRGNSKDFWLKGCQDNRR